MHEAPVALADQHVVGNRSGAGGDAEESFERCMPCAAPIEAEDELSTEGLSFAGRGKRPGPSA